MLMGRMGQMGRMGLDQRQCQTLDTARRLPAVLSHTDRAGDVSPVKVPEIRGMRGTRMAVERPTDAPGIASDVRSSLCT